MPDVLNSLKKLEGVHPLFYDGSEYYVDPFHKPIPNLPKVRGHFWDSMDNIHYAKGRREVSQIIGHDRVYYIVGRVDVASQIAIYIAGNKESGIPETMARFL